MLKKLKSLSVFLTSQILLSSLFFCFAVPASPDAPPLSSIVPIISRIINIAVGASGVVLVAMIAYGIWKSSLALGDPRGLEGAKQTWTYAIYGFFIVVGALALITIISNLLGTPISPSGFLGNISSALNSLLHPY